MTPDEARVGARVAWVLEPGEFDNGWQGVVVDSKARRAAEANWAPSWLAFTARCVLVRAGIDPVERWIHPDDLRLLPDEAQP